MTDARILPVDATSVPGGATTSTLIGPNGTTPGMGFIEQQVKPFQDSTGERAAGAPLLVAGVVLLVVFSIVFLRAWRSKKRRSEPLT